MNNGVTDGAGSAEGMKRKTVYLEEAVIRRAEKRAKEDHRSFSSYLAQLIRRDVAQSPLVNGEPVKEGSAA